MRIFNAVLSLLSAGLFIAPISAAQSGDAAATATINGLTGPAAPEGFLPEALGIVPLHDQIDGMDGRLLRTRLVTFQPGGIAPIHPHEERPTLFYVLEGEVVEHRSDQSEPQLRQAGAAFGAENGVAHWWKNETDAVAKVLATDIVTEAEANSGRAE